MRNLLARFTVFAVLAAVSSTALAQQAASGITPEAKAIIDRHFAAIGGRDALKPFDSMHATGTLAMPAQGIKGTVDLSMARPNKTLLKATIEGIGSLESAFDGERGWSIDPLMGPSLMTGKELDQARFEAVFDGPFYDLSRYTSMTAAGVETFEGRKVNRVNAVTMNGDASVEYFDVETGLHAGSLEKRATAMGAMDVTAVVGDYRKAGGALQPHRMVQRMMGAEQEIRLDRIEFNVVKPEAFSIPPAIKALIK